MAMTLTEIRVKDEGGDTMRAYDMGAYKINPYPLPSQEVVRIHELLQSFKFRDGDILIASYAKTGCTWLYEIISMLLHGGPDVTVPNKMIAMLEAIPPENVNAMASPRLLNTHTSFERLPSSIHQKKVKIVLVVRNPKDSAVSLYNMMNSMGIFDYDGKFENWLPLHIHGKLVYDSYYKYLQTWEAVYEAKSHDILLLHYEDIKEDTLREMKKLCDFLEIPLELDTLRLISEKCQFEVMKKKFEDGKYGQITYKDGKGGFLRKGVVGDWKNWFTVAQSEQMDKVMEDQLGTSKIKFRYEL